MSKEQKVLNTINSIIYKQRLFQAIRTTLKTLTISLIIAASFILINQWIGITHLINYLILGLVLAIIAGFLTGYNYPISASKVITKADQQAQLNEKLITLFEILKTKENNPFKTLLLDSVEPHLEQFQKQKITFFNFFSNHKFDLRLLTIALLFFSISILWHQIEQPGQEPSPSQQVFVSDEAQDTPSDPDAQSLQEDDALDKSEYQAQTEDPSEHMQLEDYDQIRESISQEITGETDILRRRLQERAPEEQVDYQEEQQLTPTGQDDEPDSDEALGELGKIDENGDEQLPDDEDEMLFALEDDEDEVEMQFEREPGTTPSDYETDEERVDDPENDIPDNDLADQNGLGENELSEQAERQEDNDEIGRSLPGDSPGESLEDSLAEEEPEQEETQYHLTTAESDITQEDYILMIIEEFFETEPTIGREEQLRERFIHYRSELLNNLANEPIPAGHRELIKEYFSLLTSE